MTTRTITEGTFEDPNGQDVEIHFLRYSTDKKQRTREYVEQSYDLMKYDDNSWIYNINEVCLKHEYRQQDHCIVNKVCIFTFKLIE